MIKLSKPTTPLQANITLDGSKSISNRVLLIRALSGTNFPITGLATAKDTVTLNKLLANHPAEVYDVGHAGTTFRFLTAYLALQNGTQTLTGSSRMLERPIGILVEALRELGANIEYLGKEGFPPLKINAPDKVGKQNKLKISAGTSSQYISALLMIAPTLPAGLELELDGKIVSRSYINLTLRVMAHFGAQHEWEDNVIKIAPQPYEAKSYQVEADWSAASYHYALAAFSKEVDLQLNGLQENSAQGDAAIVEMMTRFGIQTVFNENGIHLSRVGEPKPIFEWDFIECPDIAQTLAVICGGLGVNGLFTGLETLSIKETDRIKALQDELVKVQVFFSKLPARFSKKPGTYYMLEGKAVVENEPQFATYQDHRMAMAFAPLACLGNIKIEEPNVVVKSYPGFWDDLKKLGVTITEKV